MIAVRKPNRRSDAVDGDRAGDWIEYMRGPYRERAVPRDAPPRHADFNRSAESA